MQLLKEKMLLVNDSLLSNYVFFFYMQGIISSQLTHDLTYVLITNDPLRTYQLKLTTTSLRMSSFNGTF